MTTMFALSSFTQDAMVTAFAVFAFVVLVRRIVGIVRPSRDETSCGACASCPTPPVQPQGLTTVVPLTNLRRPSPTRSAV